ncbi:MAG: S24 family peptidase [Coxiellaceae bacterium]|nr:S24 family peptidase [Coxiellaceae bacterium]
MSTAIKKDFATNNLANNLQSLMNSYDIGITNLSKDLNLPMMTIRRILNGSTTDPRISTLNNIASYFSISIDELLGTSATITGKSKATFIPILRWENLNKNMQIQKNISKDWNSWLPISLDSNETISDDAIALKARPSMHPRFPKGTYFIIDPSVSPSDGDLVLSYINNKATLRTLLIDPPSWKLQSLTQSSDIVTYNPISQSIIGVTILTILFRNDSY